MKTATQLCMVLAVVGTAHSVQAQGTAFSYQGRLNQDGGPATGIYDLRFTIYDSLAGPGTIAGPLARNSVGVTNGLFTVALDFGANVFTGPGRWLEIAVRTNGGPVFTNLSPRQALLPTPYAIHPGTASNVANGSVVKSLNSLRDNVTLVGGAGVTITPVGSSITIAATNVGGTSGPWALNGASAFYNGGNVGIGTDTPAARLFVMSPTASVQDNTAAFWAPAIGGSASHIHYGTTGDWYIRSASGSGKVVLQDHGGNVGIGTQTPASKLTVFASSPGFGVEHTDGSVRLSTYVDAAGGWLGTVSNHRLHFYVNNSFPKVTVDTAGNVGIGTQSPGVKLDVLGDVRGTRLILRADPLAPANAAVLCEDPNVSNFVPYNTATGRPLKVIARELTITGGADIAEPFQMSAAEIPKGAVVVIDEHNPGHLRMSTTAYDTRVAGVVSGANGIKPGISLYQEGAMEGGENVALSGRVYVQADAATGAIKPGDLLTTSDTPGHAMKVVDPTKAQGAILGKAMSSLTEGRGTVLMLVTLQ